MIQRAQSVTNHRGFTLIEVLVAVVLSALIFWGILSFITSGISATHRSESGMKESESDRVIREALANLMVRPATRADLGTSTTGALFESDGKFIQIGSRTASGYCANDPLRELEFLQIREAAFPASVEATSSGAYSIAEDGHSVFSGSTRIIGTGIAGSHYGSPLETEIGGATSLLYSGSTLALADPSNEQILLYDTASGTLDRWNTRGYGIEGPTSLSFSGNSILIGAKNGLFRYRESTDAGDSVSVTFTGSENAQPWVTGFQVTFDGIPSFLTPTNTGSVTLESTSISPDPLDTMSVSGSGFVYSFASPQSLPADAPLHLTVSSISPPPTTVGEHATEFTLLGAAGPLWSTLIPYFNKPDGKLWTISGNVLEKIDGSMNVRALTPTSFSSGAFPVELTGTGVVEHVSSRPIWTGSLKIRQLWGQTIVSYVAYRSYDCQDGVHQSGDQIVVIGKK